MPQIIYRVWNAFGGLLDVSPHGKTDSRELLEKTQTTLCNIKDSDKLNMDFVKVGNDIASAMKKYEHANDAHP